LAVQIIGASMVVCYMMPMQNALTADGLT